MVAKAGWQWGWLLQNGTAEQGGAALTMTHLREFLETSPENVSVRGFLHTAPNSGADALVLTHGAGSNCSSPLLVALADEFSASGVSVLRCDLPFRQSRATGPPPRGSAERDQQGLRAAVGCMRRLTQGRVYLGGHSYGGRQASMLAASEPGLVERLLLLSYPLHPPQRPDELRTAHFPRLKTPGLFVHGACDGFGTLAEMEEALKLIPAPTELVPMPGAGHELLTKRNHDELPRLCVERFRSYADA
jgi:predicted alpha/beta-hydrolase family hydrolase